MSAHSHGLAVLVICIIKSIVFRHQGNRQMLLIERVAMYSKWYVDCWRNYSRGKGRREMLLFGPEQILAYFPSEYHSQVEGKSFPYAPV